MTYARPLATVLVASSLALAAPALAQPRLVTAEPANGASVAKITKVALTFSEPLVAAQSGIEVVMTGMPGMDNHAAMKMAGARVTLSSDGVTLVANLARPLSTGSYEANWHAASADTLRVAGRISFTVK